MSFSHAIDGTVDHVLFVPFSAGSEGSLCDGRSLRLTFSSGRDVGDRGAPCSYPPQIFCGCCIRSKLLGIVVCYVDHAHYRVLDLFLALRGYVWVELPLQIPSGRFGNGMRTLEQIS